MNDRQLLEAAAKAAGIKGWWSDDRDYPSIQVSNNGHVERWWNPLTDDGDALRLAVKLNCDIRFDTEPDGAVVRAVVAWDLPDAAEAICITELLGRDAAAATRRAIVRAAAAMAGEKE